jgi:hypothetical protein
MKKLYTTFAVLAISLGIQAQVAIFEDNFDAYTVGDGVVASNPLWSNWTSTASSDATVSADFSSSPSNSAHINGQATDLVLPVGPYTTGKYIISFNMMIPTGSTGAYFNGMHTWSATSTAYEWAFDVFFDGAGAVSYTLGGTNTPSSLTYALDQWFNFRIMIDLDNDSVSAKMNNEVLFAGQWSINNNGGGAGLNQLAAMDFFGTDMNSGQGSYYIDDVAVIDYTGVGVVESLSNTVAIYPNPSAHVSIVNVPQSSFVQVLDMNGKLLMSQFVVGSQLTLNATEYATGTYLVRVNHNGQSFTKKWMVK